MKKPTENIERLVAQRVVSARESLGLMQTEVADALGLSKQGYNPYETHGRFLPTQLVELSRLLGRSVDWLLGLDTDLTEDEDQLLAVYRALPDFAKAIVRDMVVSLQGKYEGGELPE